MAISPNATKSWSADQLLFQRWLATPSHQRQPRQQQQLARQLGHDPATLSDWKKIPGWGEAVYELGQCELANELVPILQAQVREAKKGSLAHAQWCFELAGVWSPKQKHELTGRDGQPIDVRTITALLPLEAMPDDGSRD
jgi:hypothetical protein